MVSKSKKSPKQEQNREENPDYSDKIYQIVTAHRTILPYAKPDPSIIKACIAASCCGTSISAYALHHHSLPSHTSCLTYLHGLNMDEMRKQSSDMLLTAGHKVIRPGQKYAFAIDKTQDPYYGKHDDKPDTYTGGGKRKASTNHFYTYFTMSIVDQGHHITLFSVPWQNDMKNVVSIQQCVELIHSLGLKIRSLCLDREFFNAAILRYLQQSGIPHIIPVKNSGKSLKAKLKGRASSTFTYTMKKGSQDSVNLVITDCVVYMMGKHKKKGLEHHAFVVFGLSTSPRNVREIYRHRFAIESTYRLRNSVRPRTSTRDEKIRYFYTLLSFIIQNMWVSEKWIRCARQKPGPKVIKKNRLSLEYFSDLIRENSELLFRLKRMDEIALT